MNELPFSLLPLVCAQDTRLAFPHLGALTLVAALTRSLVGISLRSQTSQGLAEDEVCLLILSWTNFDFDWLYLIYLNN